MIEITETALSPEEVFNRVRNNHSGCVVSYIGLIRDYSHAKPVLSVTYRDVKHDAAGRLAILASEANQKWQVEAIAISHRIGRLKVGDINLVVAVAAAHRGEGFAACQYIIDRFKEQMPTEKTERYVDD